MYNKLNQLSFVIGLFFCLVAVILFINVFVEGRSDALNLSTAGGYLLFGLLMMIL